MKYRSLKATLTGIILACYCLINTATASIIYTTGPAGDSGGGLAIFEQQHLSSRFTITEGVSIDSIRFYVNGGYPGRSGTIALYDNSGLWNGLQVPGTELFSATFTQTTPFALNESYWLGAKALNWNVEPGQYWAAIEVREGQNINLAATSFYQDGDVDENGNAIDDGRHNPSSSQEFALKTNNGSPQFDGYWRTSYNGNLAIGTLIESKDVPEPSSLTIFALGLMGLVARQCRNKIHKVIT